MTVAYKLQDICRAKDRRYGPIKAIPLPNVRPDKTPLPRFEDVPPARTVT